ncbi:MAG: AAA family ATPase [Candidatus Accumulibacter sp.]|jgi:predicted ATPase|nr:AAA family ATPase [Accumulibacter sp.]
MLKRISVQGFKSIEQQTIELGALNVVIGANGSGKSNLIGVFRLLERVLSRNLQLYVASDPDRVLFHGRKKTPALSLDFVFDDDLYGFKLKAAQDTLVFQIELMGGAGGSCKQIGLGHGESHLQGIAEGQLRQIGTISTEILDSPDFPGDYPFRNPDETRKFAQQLFSQAARLMVYHFHDTSDTSPAKQTADVDDNRFFRSDAANLPAYLYWLQEKHPVEFRRIEEAIRLVAPFFECFVLAPSKLNEKKIKLEWRQKGSDAYFDAWSLSDGTLRFICLATLLLQPNPPALILLDEPELGLHPLAIRLLAEMLDAASGQTQLLVATQSVTLLDNFPIEQIIVADHDGRGSQFRRLRPEDYAMWLENFSVGELWEKNVLGGRP